MVKVCRMKNAALRLIKIRFVDEIQRIVTSTMKNSREADVNLTNKMYRFKHNNPCICPDSVNSQKREPYKQE